MAVHETLNRTMLKKIEKGDRVNLERAMKADGRFDGHFLLGHVDTTLQCTSVQKNAGSYSFTFSFQPDDRKYMVEKGSIAINGVSLTIAEISTNEFSTAIIPYTFENTVFQYLKPGNGVNIEYDVLGKYILNAMGKGMKPKR